MEPVDTEAEAFLASPVGRGLLSNKDLWFRLVDLQGRYLFVSSQVHEMLGYTPEELAATSGFELVHPDEVEQARAATAHLQDGPLSCIYRMRHKAGHYVWMNTHAMRHGDMVVALGQHVPERFQGFSWQHVEPFV